MKNLDPNKSKSLATALESINKQFGQGSIMRLGESKTMDVDVVSTGSLALDIALGAGGLPMGRIVEVYGPESSGKQHLLWSLLRQPREMVRHVLLSMRSMHLILYTLVSLA